MTIRKHANNISTTLNGAITGIQTTITVTSATGFPSIGANETYNLTITDGTNTEIVTVTDGASSPTLTVTRGVEGTSGTAFASLDTVELRATAGSIDRKQDQVATTGEVIDFGGASSFEIPNSATPTVDANGEIAIDTTVTNFSTGIMKYYGGEEMGVVAMPIAQFTSPTGGYVVAYNATNDEFELVAQSGGGGTPGGSNTQLQYNNSGSFGGISAFTYNGTNVISTRQFNVNGSSDEVQLLVEGHSTQTSDIFKVQNSAGTKLVGIDNAGALDAKQLNIDNIRIDGNTISSTDANGDINMIPNGTGDLVIPNGASFAPTTTGGLGLDTSITDYTPLLKYYGGAEELTVLALPTTNLSTTDGYVVAYNATNNELEMVAASGSASDNYFYASRSTAQSINNVVATKVQFDSEGFDPGTLYDNVTNYRFTPTVAGKYLVTGVVSIALTTGKLLDVFIYKNGSIKNSARTQCGAEGLITTTQCSALIDMNGTTDYLEIYTLHDYGSARNTTGDNTASFGGSTYFFGSLIA